MTEANEPRPGTTADLARRVERLESVTAELGKAVDNVNHRLDLVNLTQQHQTDMMQAKFSGMESLLLQTSGEVQKITQLIEAAYRGDPAAQSAYGKQLMDEYRQFQNKVLNHIDSQDKKNDEVDDYILVQKTRSDTTSGLAQRAFGSSVLGAIGGVIGIVLGLLALLNSGAV